MARISGSISDWVQRHSLGSYKGGSDVESKSRASVDVAGEAGIQFQASKVGESYIDYSSITEPRSPHIDSSPSPRVSLTDSKIISEISISQNITPVPTPRPPPNNIEFQGVDNLDTVAITQAGSVHHDCHGNNEMVAQKLMSGLVKSGSDDLDTTITNHDDNLLMDNDGNYLVDGGDLNQTVPTRTAISGNTVISVENVQPPGMLPGVHSSNFPVHDSNSEIYSYSNMDHGNFPQNNNQFPSEGGGISSQNKPFSGDVKKSMQIPDVRSRQPGNVDNNNLVDKLFNECINQVDIMGEFGDAQPGQHQQTTMSGIHLHAEGNTSGFYSNSILGADMAVKFPPNWRQTRDDLDDSQNSTDSMERNLLKSSQSREGGNENLIISTAQISQSIHANHHPALPPLRLQSAPRVRAINSCLFPDRGLPSATRPFLPIAPYKAGSEHQMGNLHHLFSQLRVTPRPDIKCNANKIQQNTGTTTVRELPTAIRRQSNVHNLSTNSMESQPKRKLPQLPTGGGRRLATGTASAQYGVEAATASGVQYIADTSEGGRRFETAPTIRQFGYVHGNNGPNRDTIQLHQVQERHRPQQVNFFQTPVPENAAEYYNSTLPDAHTNQSGGSNQQQIGVAPHRRPENVINQQHVQRQFVPGGVQSSVLGALPQNRTGPSVIQEQQNDVDSWIDLLDATQPITPVNLAGGVGPDQLMSWMVQQYLPKVKLPEFGGSPLSWVEFIVKFRDVVHNQAYLSDQQKHQLLVQQLTGEAKRAVKGYENDSHGYVMSLKTLKHLFGQRATVARATLSKVTRAKTIGDNDVRALSDFYYSINECLTTLKQLNFSSDLYSSDTLRQAVQKMPPWLRRKWSERCLYIRRSEEPNLVHFGVWLQDRVLAMKETDIPDPSRRRGKEEKTDDKYVNVVNMKVDENKCKLCNLPHNFWRCKKYRELNPKKRADQIKKLKDCFNCSSDEYSLSNCTSKNTCFKPYCGEKRHTSLHDHFATKGENPPKDQMKKKKSKDEDKKGEQKKEQKDQNNLTDKK